MVLSRSCSWKADPSQHNSGVTGPCGHFRACLPVKSLWESDLREFCSASSFPEAPCLIFQLGGFLCWLVESKSILLYSPSLPDPPMPGRVLLNPMGVVSLTGVEPSVISVLWKDHSRVFSSLYSFHCLLEDSIFSFVVLCYFNSRDFMNFSLKIYINCLFLCLFICHATNTL